MTLNLDIFLYFFIPIISLWLLGVVIGTGVKLLKG